MYKNKGTYVKVKKKKTLRTPLGKQVVYRSM